MINIQWKLVFILVMLHFFHLFVKLECLDLPYLQMLSRLIPDNSFFTNAAKQMTKEKLIMDD